MASKTTPAHVDGYLAALPADARAALEQLRATIRVVAPEAVESISYGMPAYKYRGRPLAYFAAWKQHCALYGLDVEGHREELAPYDTSGGTIRFSPAAPLPDPLVRKLLAARIAAIEAGD